MFYRPANADHGLAIDPFVACVVPRPIAWVSTRGTDGVANLAPFSYFNAVASDPPMLMIAATGAHPHGPKDTVRNIEATGEFAINLVSWDLRDPMNASCAAVGPDVNEFDLAGVTEAPCQTISVPRVAESPITFECRLHQTIDLPQRPDAPPEARNVLFLGRVDGIHISDSVLRDGRVDPTLLKPLSRLGYRDYAVITEVFRMTRPPAAG